MEGIHGWEGKRNVGYTVAGRKRGWSRSGKNREILQQCSLSFHPVVTIIQWLSHVQLFVTPWTAACQAFLSTTMSWSLLKCMSIESVMLSNHLILCCLLVLLPSIFPSIRVFSSESVLRIRWPKYWSFSFSISPSNEYSGLISLQSKGLSRVFSNTTVQKHQFFGAQLFYSPTLTFIYDYWKNYSFD